MIVVKPIPKWAMYRYAKLWDSFKDKEFLYEEASNVLGERSNNLVSVILSYLRKNGWLSIKLHPVDNRKRIYQLGNPEKIIQQMGDVNIVEAETEEKIQI